MMTICVKEPDFIMHNVDKLQIQLNEAYLFLNFCMLSLKAET